MISKLLTGCTGKWNSFLHFWRLLLLSIEFLVDFFFFQHFKYAISLPLAYRVSREKLAVNIIEDPSCTFSHFSPADRSVDLFKLSFLKIDLFFLKFGKFMVIIFSNILSPFSSLSGIPITCILLLLMSSHRSLRFFIFFIPFSFYSPEQIISIDISSSLILSSIYVNMLLNSCSDFFHPNDCTFQPWNFYLIPFYNFSLYWYSLFI